jgi:hypothetical protein
MSHRTALALPIALLLVFAASSPISAQPGAPTYALQFLGPGSPTAISNTGTVVGARTINTQYYQPLVSVGGAPWSLLPVPPGADSVFPTDVNDAGVIVGVAYSAWNAEAVRWRPSGGGYVIDKLPKLPGDTSSYATAINNLGQVVGARRALGYVPAATSGWLYDDAGGVVDLAARFGFWVVPVDINGLGQVIGGVERLDLRTGALDDVGAGPANYNLVGPVALNDAGQMAGAASLRSSSLNIVSAFRYTPGTGWLYLAGTSRYTTASSINARGDVGYGELGAGVYFDGLGAFAVWNLLGEAATNAGWTITGSGVEINDDRVIATVGRNALTGESGAVLLTPAGTLQPPAPPVLTGVAHPATPDAPWNAISLSWSASTGATSYAVERKGPGDPSFVTLTSSTIQRIYDDTAVQPRTLYTYRVFAQGPGGRSLPSNEVSVVSPGTDTVAPVITIVSPAYNARVSGVVRVLATATDAVGVVRMEIRKPAGTVLYTVNASTITYDWNTAGLRRGSTQSLIVRAYDAAGNVGSATVVVRIAR